MLPEYELEHVVGGIASVESGSGYTVTEQSASWLIQVTAVADQQVSAWEIRAGSDWDASTTMATSTDRSFGVSKSAYTSGGTFLIRPILAAGGYSDLTLTVVLVVNVPAPVTGVSWRVAEPDLVWTWTKSATAERYRVTWTVYGVASEQIVTTPSVTVAIPRGHASIRIRAIDAEGLESEPVDEELAAGGFSYSYNEVVRISLPISSGRGLNLCVPSGTQIRRASIIGTTPALPIAADNDCDLYSFVGNFDGKGAISGYASTPLSWFKQDWWLNRAGWFESGTLDLGAIYSGYMNLSLTTSLTNYGADGAISNFDHILPEYINDILVSNLIDNHAAVTAQFLVSADGSTWTQAINGQWLASVRYLKLSVTVSEASPLTEILVTAGSVWLDVPDITESGSVADVGTAGTVVNLTKTFRNVKSVIATARGTALASVASITNSTITLRVNTGTATVDYFVKGY